MPRIRSFPLSFAAFAALSAATACAQQPFTYQGQLKQSGQPFNGTASLEFRLVVSETGGTAIDSETLDNVAVDDGLFSVILGDEPDWQRVTPSAARNSARATAL